jgi:hypothetical protein
MGVYKNTVALSLPLSFPQRRAGSGPVLSSFSNSRVISVPEDIHVELFADFHQRHCEEAA